MTIPIRLIRRPERVSGGGSPPTRRYRYRVVGTNVPTYALNLVKADAPSVIATPQGILFRREPTYDQTAYDRFDLEVEYAARSDEPGKWTWDGDATGETVNVTIAKESIRRYSASTSEAGSASAVAIPKFNGAINVQDDDTVVGTSIVIPAIKFNVAYKYPPGVVTPAHFKFLGSLVGKVSSTPFLAWAAGETLMIGARASAGDQVESTVNMSFAISDNATSLSFGSIANVAKKGWEYCWIRFETTESLSHTVKNPKYAYVERLYDTADLAGLLGIS